MRSDKFTFIIGGKAGEGVKKAGATAASIFNSMGREIFQMDDYMSLIRGGHNFSVVSSSTEPIYSQYMKADLVVSLDKRSYENHGEHLSERGVHVFDSDEVEDGKGTGLPLSTEARKLPNASLRIGLSGISVLCAAIGLETDRMEQLIKDEYPRDLDNNLAFAKAVYDMAYEKIGGRFELEGGGGKKAILSGNESIALGLSAAGLDMYMAYPMTPASSILHFFAAHDKELKVAAVHPESEIAAANMAVGAAFTGARTAVGTSGGGFALMEEALSLAGMAEVPLMCVMSSRPGPSTGVPTYTEQADLDFTLSQGHGEFPRVVASPGSIEEAYHLSGELLRIAWRFQVVSTLLTEKHLSESRMSVDLRPDDVGEEAVYRFHEGGPYKRYLSTSDGISPLELPPSEELIKVNSYEHDERGITTEEPGIIVNMHDKRNRKGEALIDHIKGLRTVNTLGDEGPVIFAYGSTTMSVLEALKEGSIEATLVQPIYLRPFPIWEMDPFCGEEAIVVEQSSTGQFTELLKEKGGLNIRTTLKRYDGRPFDPAELAAELKEVI